MITVIKSRVWVYQPWQLSNLLTLFICFILFSWVFNLSPSSKALFRRTSTVLWTAAACLWDLFRLSISYTEHIQERITHEQFTWVMEDGVTFYSLLLRIFGREQCSQTLCKAVTCSWRPSHFLADSSAKALCFSICVCWMLVVFCSLARSSSISFIFALSFAFSSSFNNRNTMLSTV